METLYCEIGSGIKQINLSIFMNEIEIWTNTNSKLSLKSFSKGIIKRTLFPEPAKGLRIFNKIYKNKFSEKQSKLHN